MQPFMMPGGGSLGYRFSQILACFLLVLGLGVGLAVHAEPSAEAKKEVQAAVEAAEAVQQRGPQDIALGDQAHLKLPKGYAWVRMPEAGRLLRAMGNRIDERSFLGAIFPEDDANWMVTVRFVKEGYIKDDEAKDWNADELLQSLKDGTEASNEERRQRGFAELEVTGWAEKPQYEASSHRLVWSALVHGKGSTDANQSVNYNTYALGREGYISLNLITSAQELPKYRPDALALLGALQYDEGRRYADFDSSTDKVAAYGLAALVGGVALKKLGLMAVILAFVAKFAKLFIVAGGAVMWSIAKFFGKKKPEAKPLVSTPVPANLQAPAQLTEPPSGPTPPAP